MYVKFVVIFLRETSREDRLSLYHYSQGIIVIIITYTEAVLRMFDDFGLRCSNYKWSKTLRT